MDNRSSQGSSPAETTRDRACAVLARAALFPISVDWAGNHRTIRPALQALDLLRSDVIKSENVPFSKLFPRHVIVVPSSAGGMQWNGQPDITDSNIEVIPNKLTVKSIHCGGQKTGVLAFTENKKDDAKNVYHEIVLCTDRLLQSDYNRVSDQTLLEQRRDLPPQSLTLVEEVLAHEITKLRLQSTVNKETSLSACEKLATLEVIAARMAECLYQKGGNEFHRGSALRPVGFSLLPQSLQENFRNRCVRIVATQATKREFDKDGSNCVDFVLREQSS